MLTRKSIAVTKASFRFPSGNQRAVSLELSAPFRKGKIWHCEVDFAGLDGEHITIFANDALNAVGYGLVYLRTRIDAYRKAGTKVHYLSSDKDVTFNYLFPPGHAEDGLPNPKKAKKVKKKGAKR